MDRYRRRPPMEGFSRPGSLGGEAHDDDSVEGHQMDDDRNQDIDTEGHGIGFKAVPDDDDTEGHRRSTPTLRAEGDEDDTEGHRRSTSTLRAEDDDDTEGHRMIRATEDDDTEGHGLQRRLSDDDDTEGHAHLK